jgi:hypothetical protein
MLSGGGIMYKLVTLKDGTEYYKITIIIFNNNTIEAWEENKDLPHIIPINKISTIS